MEKRTRIVLYALSLVILLAMVITDYFSENSMRAGE